MPNAEERAKLIVDEHVRNLKDHITSGGDMIVNGPIIGGRGGKGSAGGSVSIKAGSAGIPPEDMDRIKKWLTKSIVDGFTAHAVEAVKEALSERDRKAGS